MYFELNVQVVTDLQVHPEPVRRTESPRQPQSRIRADRPLAAEGVPWKTVTGDLAENRLVTREATRSPAEIFGLPPDWPGPDGPFDN